MVTVQPIGIFCRIGSVQAAGNRWSQAFARRGYKGIIGTIGVETLMI